ncbi:MAG: TerB family tellurite resistance protein [Planctomycetes bacterium]|nr:TerB family tellurite resistance protein [Planctomycetota bacterium]
MLEALDFRKIPAAERLAHYGLLFAMAAADGSFCRDEMVLLHRLLETEGMDREQRDRLQLFITHPPALEDCLKVLQGCGDEIRHGTLLGLVDVAFADGVLTEREEKALEEVRASLGIDREQLTAMTGFVDFLGDLDLRREPNEAELKAFAARAGTLARVGIPLAAVTFSPSISRLLREGHESLRAALGFGLGQVPGTPISVVVGTQISLGVSELLHGHEGGDEALRARRLIRRERMQDALEHLQVTIDELGREIERRRAGQETDELETLEDRRLGLIQLVRTRRSALEDL